MQIPAFIEVASGVGSILRGTEVTNETPGNTADNSVMYSDDDGIRRSLNWHVTADLDRGVALCYKRRSTVIVYGTAFPYFTAVFFRRLTSLLPEEAP